MLNIDKHRNIIFQILKDIAGDIDISPILGFKGGTAALIFYGLNRFSVDLDFDLLDESKEDYKYNSVGCNYCFVRWYNWLSLCDKEIGSNHYSKSNK